MTIKELYQKIQQGHISDATIENYNGKECVAVTYIYRPFEPQDKQISIQFQCRQFRCESH